MNTDILNEAVRAKFASDEQLVRELLGRWVSEIPPAIVFDKRGNIVGLCAADVMLDTKPFVLKVQ